MAASSLKGLTRAQIHARHLARLAALKKKGKSSSGRIRVSSATIKQISSMGRAAARAAALKPGVSKEFLEGVRRYYPDRASDSKKIGARQTVKRTRRRKSSLKTTSKANVRRRRPIKPKKRKKSRGSTSVLSRRAS